MPKGIPKEELQNLLAKYKGQISNQLAPVTEENAPIKVVRTKVYQEFRDEYLPKHMSWYEKACNQFDKIFKLKPSPKKELALKESIDVCHLNITPSGVYSLAMVAPLLIGFMGFAISYLITGGMFFPLFFLILAAALLGPLNKAPHMMANSWRMQASNQMVLAVFYIVTYMRHTSNIELAVDFASDYLKPPLSLDLKRVVWNVETEKYESVRESLDNYLQTWRKYNMEFIEALHLVEGSLLESDDNNRLIMLDKSLTVILEETFEKMMHYAQNLKGPITMLHMLGIILPILGLVILPLAVSFMEGVGWYHIATLYNLILPASVFYLGKNILSTRPTGYGDVDISKNPAIQKFSNVNFFGMSITPLYFCIAIGIFFLFIAFLPLIIHQLNPGWDMIFTRDGSVEFLDPGVYEHEQAKFYFLGYIPDATDPDKVNGPYGLGSALISVFLPLSLGVPIGLFYRLKTKNVKKIRDQTKKLENEFASALFQLGNRLGDGIPVELAFQRVAESMSDTLSGQFFAATANNITRLGMSVEQAIFDENNGSANEYPSDLIETSMKVLIESSRKGPMIAAQAVINVSRYIKEMHRVDERLKDLMSDTVSSLKSQIGFLAPCISGIVIGITSMVTTILTKLTGQLTKIQADGAASGAGANLGLSSLFGQGMPTFYFQIIVGFYVVQLVYIMTIMVNGIENGSDKLNEKYLIGANLMRATILYSVIALGVMFAFNMIAGNVVGNGI
ncbi:hypothetical protein HN587_01025 [Candidatus Woesearchaeota archaeon]|jgi:hypothetical protein|nr:hypothetical protein [Candidatus Woesearchaeota archaeon]